MVAAMGPVSPNEPNPRPSLKRKESVPFEDKNCGETNSPLHPSFAPFASLLFNSPPCPFVESANYTESMEGGV